MMVATEHPAVVVPRLFDDIVCGVDGTRGAYEAVRQAAALAEPGGAFTLLAVTAMAGSGQYQTVAISPERAGRALRYARRLAAAGGIADAVLQIDDRPPVPETLLVRAREHHLLAIGAPYMSRLVHVLVGGTATELAHQLTTSLLVARRPPAGTTFAERLLVASDGSCRSDALIRFAVDLALERDAQLTLVHSVRAEEDAEPAIAAQVALVTRALGGRAGVRIEGRRPRALILDTARAEGCSLIIVASRRLRGLRAIGSLTERLVHDARCSVLVLRPEDVAPAR